MDRVRANLLLITQRKLSIALALIWPLIGLSFLSFMLIKGRPLNSETWIVIIGCLFFFPFIVAIGAAANHLLNKHAREEFTYLFNSTGIHVSAASYELTHRWSTISRVKQLAGFVMFFFSPGCAHCVPLRAVRAAGVLGPLLRLAKENGAVVDGT